MKKQYMLPLISTLAVCVSLGASAGDLTLLRFEKKLLKTGTQTKSVMGYLTQYGQRLTPESCVITEGSSDVSVQVALGGCMVSFLGENGGYARVQAELNGESSSFIALSTQYSFEHPYYYLDYGTAVTNKLRHNGTVVTPFGCTALHHDAGITYAVEGGCYFKAGNIDASDTIAAVKADGSILDAFEVVVGKGELDGYHFEDEKQTVLVNERRENVLTRNGTEVHPSVCIADPDVVDVGTTDNGCYVIGKKEGITEVAAYGSDVMPLSEYQVTVTVLVDSDYDGVKDEHDDAPFINNSMDATNAYGIEKWSENIQGQASSQFITVSDRTKYYDVANNAVFTCPVGEYFDGAYGHCFEIIDHNTGDMNWDLNENYINLLTTEMKNYIQEQAN